MRAAAALVMEGHSVPARDPEQNLDHVDTLNLSARSACFASAVLAASPTKSTRALSFEFFFFFFFFCEDDERERQALERTSPPLPPPQKSEGCSRHAPRPSARRCDGEAFLQVSDGATRDRHHHHQQQKKKNQILKCLCGLEAARGDVPR
jgi:hypothetical protein